MPREENIWCPPVCSSGLRTNEVTTAASGCTLQRRVKEWRARALLQFDDQWLNEEVLVGIALPRPLRATVDNDPELLPNTVEGSLQ